MKTWLKNLIKDLQDVIKDDIAQLKTAANKVAAIKCYLADMQVMNDVMRWAENPDFCTMDSEDYVTSEYHYEIWKRVECNHRHIKQTEKARITIAIETMPF